MHKLTIACSLALAAALTACGDSKLDPTAPTTTIATEMVSSSTQSPSVSVRPSTMTALPVADGSCPSVAPFIVPFDVFVTAGSTTLILTDVSMRFVDTQGVQMPQVTMQMPPVTLTAPLPTTPFGTALVEARTTRNFSLQLPIGCGTGRAGTVIIIIDARDGLGHPMTMQVTATVR